MKNTLKISEMITRLRRILVCGMGLKSTKLITRLHRILVCQIARKVVEIGSEIGKMITRIRCNLVNKNGENREPLYIYNIYRGWSKKSVHKNTVRIRARVLTT